MLSSFLATSHVTTLSCSLIFFFFIIFSPFFLAVFSLSVQWQKMHCTHGLHFKLGPASIRQELTTNSCVIPFYLLFSFALNFTIKKYYAFVHAFSFYAVYYNLLFVKNKLFLVVQISAISFSFLLCDWFYTCTVKILYIVYLFY